MADQITILTWIQTFAVTFSLVGVLVAVYSLRQTMNQSTMERVGQISCDKSSMGYFVVKTPRFLGPLTGKKVELPQLPTIGYLIRAGDNLVYTSAMFDHAPPFSTKVCWVNLYTQFFDQIALRQDIKKIDFSKYHGLADILSRASSNVRRSRKGVAHFGGVMKAWRAWKTRQPYDVENLQLGEELPQGLDPEIECLYERKKLVKCVRDLGRCERKELALTLPRDTPAQWLPHWGDLRQPQVMDQKPCIEVSQQELAGLALALGMCLSMEDSHTIEGTGPFGICLRGQRRDTEWRVHVTHQIREPDQKASKGSGYSILFAKHMACGSLPFGQSESLIHSVFVDESVLAGIKQGLHISYREFQPAPALIKYLSHLPSARRLRIYGTQRESGNTEGGTLRRGSILDADFKVCDTTWPQAVAGIAFGGLVPQANKTLVDAVQFTVGGRVNTCSNKCTHEHPCYKLITALLHLRDTIDKNDRSLNLFGREVVEDYSSLRETFCFPQPTCRHSGSLFARYMTILERVMAISGSRIEDVYDRCCQILEKAYDHAVEMEKTGKEEEKKKSEYGLAFCIEGVEKKIGKVKVTPDECAEVARCIIAAWAYRVRHIGDLKWDKDQDYDDLVNRADRQGFVTASRDYIPTLQELPTTSLLGLR